RGFQFVYRGAQARLHTRFDGLVKGADAPSFWVSSTHEFFINCSGLLHIENGDPSPAHVITLTALWPIMRGKYRVKRAFVPLERITHEKGHYYRCRWPRLS